MIIKLKKSNYNYTIKTRSTIIKPITQHEITDKYVSWLNDKELNQYLEIRHFKQTKQSIEGYINSLRINEKCEMFAIFDNENQNHIGNLTITSYNNHNNGSVDFGLMIADEKSRLMGFGAEVHLAFLEFIFLFDEINRVSAGVASENKRSWKTLESIGYFKEGVRRKSFPLMNGERCDLKLYGLLREEWIERKIKFIEILKNISISK